MKQEPRFHELILASGSTARRQLLERLGLPFECHPADIDESPLEDESPEAMVQRLSLAKAGVIARQLPASWVIGSDQAAVSDGHTSGKPGTVERARAALAENSGGEVEFLTGLALVHRESAFSAYLLDRTVVRFRTLDPGEIARYVDMDQPLDCAGSFRVESLGPSLFEEVRSLDPTALMGLPLIGLCRLLREAGFTIP